MTKSEIDQSRAVLDEIDIVDEMRIKTLEQMNSFEDFIYQKDKWFESEDTVYASPSELKLIKSSFEELKKWFQEHGQWADLSALSSKHDEIKKIFGIVEARSFAHKTKDREAKMFGENMNEILSSASKASENDADAKAHFNRVFIPTYNNVKEWFNEKVKEQENHRLYEDPVFTSEQIQQQYFSLKKHILKMNNFNSKKDL